MSKVSRRRLMTGGFAAAGVAGLAAAAGIGKKLGLIPPDCGGIYGAGTTLTYAAQRLLSSHSMAREFRRDQISKKPFAYPTASPTAEFKRLQAGGFAEWRLAIDGMVSRPMAFSIPELKSMPSRSQITHLACEEGWSYIAEWTGVPLSHVLAQVGVHPNAKYVVYFSTDPEWWDSIDMSDALHPQTLVAYGLNGSELPIPSGGPLRMRLPKQLGYKSVKYITKLTLTDDLKKFGKGLGSTEPESGYSWYAGI